MKKKVAILTQPLGHNYGGIIQNYALQEVLTDLGHETITVNRRDEHSHSKMKVLASDFKKWLLKLVSQSNSPEHFNVTKLAANNYRFLNKYINLSPEINSTAVLANYFSKKKFNAVVVGSDQVWRPKYSPNIFNFYLNFLQSNSKIKKVAYASSFGTDDWEYGEEQTKKCAELINLFDAVSVREKSGIKMCSNHLNYKNAIHVLDPTLLLDAEQYNKIIGDKVKLNGLFTYVLDDSEDKLNFIAKCAKELKMDIFTNQAKSNRNSSSSRDMKDFTIPPLEGWLQGFRDAEFVITDSFHGTVFSIINQKPFLALVNNKRGASRFESILSLLGLEDRLIYDVENYDESLLKSVIDYHQVHLKLNILKKISLNFLKNNI